MSAEAGLIILENHSDGQICEALQAKPTVRARLQRILQWGPPPAARTAHSTSQSTSQGTAQQQAPWPDGSGPAMSGPPPVQFGGPQVQRAPDSWTQQSTAGQTRNWSDITDREQAQQHEQQQAQRQQHPYDWDARSSQQAQPDAWYQWESQSNKGSPGKGKAQQQQAEHRSYQQAPSSWDNWQSSSSGKGKGWDPFAQNHDWTSQQQQPFTPQQAPQAQQAQHSMAEPSPATPLQPSLHVPSHELKWAGDRPYHQNARTGEWLCALACTNTFCQFGRPACNFKPKGRIIDDRHSPHRCSHCLAKGAGK